MNLKSMVKTKFTEKIWFEQIFLKEWRYFYWTIMFRIYKNELIRNWKKSFWKCVFFFKFLNLTIKENDEFKRRFFLHRIQNLMFPKTCFCIKKSAYFFGYFKIAITWRRVATVDVRKNVTYQLVLEFLNIWCCQIRIKFQMNHALQCGIGQNFCKCCFWTTVQH
jgi:hypothetical protein